MGAYSLTLVPLQGRSTEIDSPATGRSEKSLLRWGKTSEMDLEISMLQMLSNRPLHILGSIARARMAERRRDALERMGDGVYAEEICSIAPTK